jgi:hypothetical protein
MLLMLVRTPVMVGVLMLMARLAISRVIAARMHMTGLLKSEMGLFASRSPRKRRSKLGG